MTDLQSLQQLRGRVSTLDGPDQEVDEAIRSALGQDPVFDVAGYGGVAKWVPEPYTNSIDAALALVERVLPGETMILETGQHEEWEASAEFHDHGRPRWFAPTLPPAILLALLDVLISEKAKAEEPAAALQESAERAQGATDPRAFYTDDTKRGWFT